MDGFPLSKKINKNIFSSKLFWLFYELRQILITSHEYDDKSLYVHLQISISFYIKVFQNVNKIENVEKSF